MYKKLRVMLLLKIKIDWQKIVVINKMLLIEKKVGVMINGQQGVSKSLENSVCFVVLVQMSYLVLKLEKISDLNFKEMII